MHQKPPRHFCMLFFDVLLFIDDARVVNGKTSKKSVQNRRGGFGVSRPLKPSRRFCMLSLKFLHAFL